MITPVKEGYLSSDSARFVWHSAGSGMHYRLTVANQVGDLVWEAETADTVLQLPVEFDLIVGARYVWYVDAMGEDGESVTSGPLSFTAR